MPYVCREGLRALGVGLVTGISPPARNKLGPGVENGRRFRSYFSEPRFLAIAPRSVRLSGSASMMTAAWNSPSWERPGSVLAIGGLKQPKTPGSWRVLFWCGGCGTLWLSRRFGWLRGARLRRRAQRPADGRIHAPLDFVGQQFLFHARILPHETEDREPETRGPLFAILNGANQLRSESNAGPYPSYRNASSDP